MDITLNNYVVFSAHNYDIQIGQVIMQEGLILA